MEEWGFISTMIEMVLAGASKKDLARLKDSKAVKREAAVLNVVETGEDYNSINDYLDAVAKAAKKK